MTPRCRKVASARGDTEQTPSPSCNVKHVAQTAAHLVDNVLPFVPFRQVVPVVCRARAARKVDSRSTGCCMLTVCRRYTDDSLTFGAETTSFAERWAEHGTGA